jgi:MFS family permease
MVSGQYILLTYTIADLHQSHRLSLAVAGLVLAMSQLGGGMGRVVLGQLSDRLGGRRAPVLAVTAAIGTVTATAIGLLPGKVSLLLVFPLWVVFGFGVVGWNALALTWAGESVPSAHSGFAMSLTGTIVFLGSSIFPPFFGWIVDTTHRFSYGWGMLALVLALAALIAARANTSR